MKFDRLIICLLLANTVLEVSAKDLGKHGATFLIAEEDVIKYIKNRVKVLEESGELARHQQLLSEKVKKSLENPRAIEGISNTITPREFYYDPTYVLNEDLKDHKGNIIHKKGYTVNPLSTVSFGPDMLFINGDDALQVDWAKHYSCEPFVNHSKTTAKVILVGGSPLNFEKRTGVKSYFDQAGFITGKLGIKQVPAIVSQDNLRLKVQEIKLIKETNA